MLLELTLFLIVTESMLNMHCIAVILTFLVWNLAPLQAVCPNLCSLHGYCDFYDKCSCFTGFDGYPAWTGADCSLMTCPRYYCIILYILLLN